MTYSTLNKSKFGDCTQCGMENTDCVKQGKVLVCLSCNRANKAKKQIQNQREKSQIRQLISNPNKRQTGLSYLIEDLDTIVSRYVRIREANEQGVVTCFTCGAMGHFTLFDAGHFISRSHLATRWQLINLKCQCKNCNQFKSGNLKVYAEKLGEEIVNFLHEASREIYKPTQDDLKGMIYDYRMKLKLVESKLKK